MFKHLSFFILIITGMIILTQCGKKPEIVAKVGTETITLDEFKNSLNQLFHTNDFSKISYADKEKTLKEMLEYRLKILRAKELGLDKDPEYTEAIKAKENLLIAQKLYEKEIVDKLVPEDLMRLFFNLRRTEIKLIAIPIGYRDAQMVRAERSKDEAVKLAREIAEKLKNGEDAQKLAETYSDDKVNKQKKGLVNPYNPGMFDLEVDRAIYKAGEGDIVGPVVTPRGVFVLKILEKREMSGKADFEAEKQNLKRQLFQRFFMEKANENYENTSERFKNELGWSISDKGIEEFLKAVKEWAKLPRPSDNQFPAEKRKIELARIGDKVLDAGYFIGQFGGRFYKFYPKYTNAEEVRKALEKHIQYWAWIINARRRGLENDPDVVKEINKLKRTRLRELFDRREIKDKAVYTEDDVKAYYEENKQKYVEPRKIEIWEIAVKDEQLANKIYQLARRKNANFEKLAEQYTEKPAMKKRKGKLGFQTERASANEVVKRAFAAGPNKLVKPFRYGVYYYVIKTGELKPSRQKSLDEVRVMVENGVRKKKEVEIRDRLMEELHKKYPFWINESLLRRLS